MRNLFPVVALLTATSAFASVSISKDYLFPPQLLETLEGTISKASRREPMEYPAFYEIDDANMVSLWCPPHQPQSDGTGCQLNFLIGLPNGATIGIRKNIQVNGLAAKVKNRLASTSPNTTDDHQHFGTLFGNDDSSGSHYFCQPEGSAGSKTWQCYLAVIEQLNK